MHTKGGSEETKTEASLEPFQKAPVKAASTEPVLPDISYIDLRVGRVIEIWKNPASDKLYNEKVDIGNGEIRCIASGL